MANPAVDEFNKQIEETIRLLEREEETLRRIGALKQEEKENEMEEIKRRIFSSG